VHSSCEASNLFLRNGNRWKHAVLFKICGHSLSMRVIDGSTVQQIEPIEPMIEKIELLAAAASMRTVFDT
jgi:hypothetical protein